MEFQTITNKKNEYEKIYKIKTCTGDSELCGELSYMEFQIIRKDNEIFIKKLFLDELVASKSFLVRVINVKNFNKSNRFDHIVTFQHIKGNLQDLKISGKLENYDFIAENFSFRSNGKELVSGVLELL